MGVKVGELIATLNLDKAGFETGLKSANSSLGLTEKQINNIKNKAVMGLGAGLTGLGAIAFSASNSINEGMANVATLIPGATERVKELKGEVQSLAISTGKSTDDISGGLYQVISAFGDTADTTKILEMNVKAAAAGVATTTEAINLTSAVTKAYGDTSAESVGKVADLAFMAVKLGQTDFPQLASSIGRVTPLAKEMMVTQEELFAVMATATGVTGGAAEVSTQLRGVLQSLMAPSADMTKLIEQMGFESGKAMVKELGLKGAIDAVVGTAEQSNMPLQKLMGSIEGQTLALTLAGSQSDVYKEKLGEMSKAAGAANTAYTEQTEGINKMGFAWERTKQLAIVATQKLGSFSPALMGLGSIITMISGLGAMGISFGTVAAAASAAWVAITGPVGLVVLAIAAIGAAVYAGFKIWQKYEGVIKEFVANALDSLASFVKNIPFIGEKAGAAIEGMSDKIRASIKEVSKDVGTEATKTVVDSIDVKAVEEAGKQAGDKLTNGVANGIKLSTEAEDAAAEKTKKLNETMQRQLNDIVESFMTERELEDKRYQEKLDNYNKSASALNIAEQTQNDYRKKIKEEHEKRISDIEDKAVKDRIAKREASRNTALEALRKEYATEEELENQRYNQKVMKLVEAFEKEGAFTQEYFAILDQMKAEHDAKMLEIETGKTEAEREREATKNAEKVERIQAQFATEEMLENARYAKKLADLQIYQNLEGTTVDAYNAAREEVETAHMEALKQIRTDGMTEIEKFTSQSMEGQITTVIDGLKTMASGAARQNKAMFQVNKAAAIADAIVSTYQGVAKTMGSYPFPVNVAMAAASLAAGMAQVQSIRAQSFAKGGLVTGPVLGEIGEAMDDEAVLPLNNNVLGRLGSQIAEHISSDSTGEGKSVNIQVMLDGKTIAQAISQPMADRIRITTGLHY